MTIRIVFMGSPDFALPGLQVLADHYAVVGVVTQPDRPSGRGRVLTPPPVKTLAIQLGIPVIQPARLREPAAMEQLAAWAPDLVVVAAYGQILRKAVLDLPAHGCINVHASLLPRWRGAAPISAAILHGDQETGITIMRMDAGLDTGAIVSRRAEPIQAIDTTASLSGRLAQLGAELLKDTLPGYLSGQIAPQAQDESLATYAPMLKKKDGLLDFNQPAIVLERRVRAFNPWPGAYIEWQGEILKIHRAAVETSAANLPPGQFLRCQGFPAISTTEGCLVLLEVQLAGKKSMPGKVFLSGARTWGS